MTMLFVDGRFASFAVLETVRWPTEDEGAERD
jgi:hypothetical protein